MRGISSSLVLFSTTKIKIGGEHMAGYKIKKIKEKIEQYGNQK